MTREQWLGSHPYLRPLAEFHSALDEAVAASAPVAAAVPEFEDHRADYLAGVPLLQSSGVVLDLEPAAQLLTPLFARLAARPPPGRQAAELRALEAQLRATPDAPRRALAWLLGQGEFPSSAPGMLQFAGWHALARFLQPLVQAFGAWRDDERWLRRYCPTCGAPPAMAQLVGNDPGRKRIFCCGRCRSRWRYGRTQCPFCELDAQRLSVLAIEGEGGLRLDHCDSCRGYLKTCAAEGDEALLLADWSSLHLDVLAQERGLARLAGSLYELEPARLR